MVFLLINLSINLFLLTALNIDIIGLKNNFLFLMMILHLSCHVQRNVLGVL